MLDICCALIGRAPASGLHITSNRAGRLLLRLLNNGTASTGPHGQELHLVPVVFGMKAAGSLDDPFQLGGPATSRLESTSQLGTDIPGDLEDTFDDYLVGAGVDFGLGGAVVRVNLDTISFDTLRATAGVGFKF